MTYYSKTSITYQQDNKENNDLSTRQQGNNVVSSKTTMINQQDTNDISTRQQ